MSINQVAVSGNIGQEPEIRQTASGMAVMKFTVAVNERRKNNQTGEWDNYTNWFDVTMFGSRVPGLSQYLHKGMKVGIQGKLRYSTWEKDGQKRSKVEIIADEIEFMSQRQQGQQPQQQPQGQPQYAEAVTYNEPQAYDEDIPF